MTEVWGRADTLSLISLIFSIILTIGGLCLEWRSQKRDTTVRDMDTEIKNLTNSLNSRAQEIQNLESTLSDVEDALNKSQENLKKHRETLLLPQNRDTSKDQQNEFDREAELQRYASEMKPDPDPYDQP